MYEMGQKYNTQTAQQSDKELKVRMHAGRMKSNAKPLISAMMDESRGVSSKLTHKQYQEDRSIESMPYAETDSKDLRNME